VSSTQGRIIRHLFYHPFHFLSSRFGLRTVLDHKRDDRICMQPLASFLASGTFDMCVPLTLGTEDHHDAFESKRGENGG
jgi:hypothetical protein